MGLKNSNAKKRLRNFLMLSALIGIGASAAVVSSNGFAAANNGAQYSDWPRIQSRFSQNQEMERQIAQIVASMTLEQKIGQMTQPEIKKITPDEVRQYYIGSVLNGGGSWPQMNKRASVQDWVNLSNAYYQASMTTNAQHKIPIIWGIDAVHGNNNIHGATIFPHNIGLGAARDAALVEAIAASTAKSVRAIGLNWAFAPTLAVVQNQRWGRAYEGFGQNPQLVRQYASAYIRGMQGDLSKDINVVASAKHFLGDGGTHNGVNEGENRSSMAELINIHGQGYYGAIEQGVQTIMATYNSWGGAKTDTNNGKIHGVRELLTGALKEKIGFDGMVVSDYNGIGQVQGCTNDHCPEAINSGIDMVMVPDLWKEFIQNTIKDVNEGRIPMSRIDDAVSRILRVKFRAGLFTSTPTSSSVSGQVSAIVDKELARRAVRESLVLLKNNNNALPIARGKKILIVGRAANSIPHQTGGWSITWQGDEIDNSDFPNGETLLHAIQSQNLGSRVVYSADGKGVNVRQFDVVIAVLSEDPYAETRGDIRLPAPMTHSVRYPQDLAALNEVSGKGVKVISILYSGRTLYTNDLINKSDAFVAAFLPGTEARGISDVLFAKANGRLNYNFRGKLPFAWPSDACPPALNAPQASYRPLFNYGFSLVYGQNRSLGNLRFDNRTQCPTPQ